MVIEYCGRKIEITQYHIEDMEFNVTEAYYIDIPEMPELTDIELESISENCYEQIFEKMPKGNGY